MGLKNRLRWIFIEDVDKGKIKNSYSVTRLWVWVLLLSIIWVISGFLVYHAFPENKSDAGTFGDMFGAVNALFSGLAFGGIIYTILLQRTELKFQREELELQRAEIKRSGDELEGQKKLMAIQRFENTFFQLINLNHEIVGNMTVKEQSFKRKRVDITSVWEEFEGREVFNRFYASLKNQLRHFQKEEERILENGEVYTGPSGHDRIVIIFEEVYKKYEGSMGHYFRNLYHTIRWVHNANCFENNEEKKEYIRIIRSQLSSYELIVLYYNCMVEQGGKLKELAVEYNLFDNINYNLLIDVEHKKMFEQP
ncbi:putative phage abortive infection protein [Paenibacillus alvei]|uniref:Putative phage abortive infection protein n=1 Tax=Paenibacillus alvei TaxID=44250 RepID=A0A383RE81_PAEAL|nr:putative phage abortive infection protein [Paenibacillus alvei]SYX84629.1 putative phage abortive infection protein [Paenibacillus alvei]